MHTNHKFFSRFSFVLALSLISQFAQAQTAQGNSSVYVIGILIVVGSLILVSAILTLSQNFLTIKASEDGVDLDGEEKGLSINSLWKGAAPLYTNGAKVTELKQGHDILLKGKPTGTPSKKSVSRFSVNPNSFRGLSPIPKVVVNVGDEVKAGDTIYYDKKNPVVKFVAPVSGEVIEINRGEKRSITDIVILADSKIEHTQFDPPSISEASRDDIVSYLLNTGGWTLLNQRPYDVLPAHDAVPSNIFISTFDTAPLSPDTTVVMKGRGTMFQKGLDTLNRLTDGKVYLGLSANSDEAPDAALTGAKNVEKCWFKGKHPSGNVGIQIHHTAPIGSGQTVWTLGIQEVITLGELMHKGIYNARRIVAVGGANVINPGYIDTYVGANIGDLLKDNLTGEKNRLIDGDALSGVTSSAEAYLRHRSDQISVIEEGDYYEIFGWLLPLKARPTVSKTFPNFLYPNLEFDGDTSTHGEQRAFVMSGQYEKVLPMDLYPQHLLKAIMTGDFEQMEGLGIYELSEEDLALCEFVCTSKMPVQEILRGGLDMMREQG